MILFFKVKGYLPDEKKIIEGDGELEEESQLLSNNFTFNALKEQIYTKNVKKFTVKQYNRKFFQGSLSLFLQVKVNKLVVWV